MKVIHAVSLLLAVLTLSVSAFVPSAPFGVLRSKLSSTTRTTIFAASAGPEEEEGLDLDLEEMFDM